MEKAGRQSAVCNGTTAARLTSYGSTSVSDSNISGLLCLTPAAMGF